jgi:hypothetical protein
MSVTVQAPPAKKKRGRETAADMIRSMGLILLIVIPVWYLAQPPDSDEAEIRVVDPTSDVASYVQAVPGVPTPGGLPPQWRPTSSTLEPGALRIGYVTPASEYAEYASSTDAAFLGDISGQGSQVGTVDVGGVVWRDFRDDEDHQTLVREVAGATVVVGGLRETASPEELRDLAAAVR